MKDLYSLMQEVLSSFAKASLDVVLGPTHNSLGNHGSISVSPPHECLRISGWVGLTANSKSGSKRAKLNDSLSQLEAVFEAGRIGSRLQVDQARWHSLTDRVVCGEVFICKPLYGYKIFLGLPQLEMKVVDDYIQSFRLTDAELVILG